MTTAAATLNNQTSPLVKSPLIRPDLVSLIHQLSIALGKAYIANCLLLFFFSIRTENPQLNAPNKGPSVVSSPRIPLKYKIGPHAIAMKEARKSEDLPTAETIRFRYSSGCF